MSLLTQFYPGPGGGGGTSPGFSGGSYISTEGMRSPWVGTSVSAAGAPVQAVTNNLASLTGVQGTGDKVTFVGMYVQLSPNNDTEVSEIVLSSSTLYLDCGVAQPNLTTISGSGACIVIRDPLLTGVYSNLVSISTDITFITWAARYQVLNAKLDVTTVNHILTSLISTKAQSTSGGARILDLSGGTSAGVTALTAGGYAAALAAIPLLTGAGWTVNLNA